MPQSPIDYPRDRLHDEVWAQPLDVVASRYGLSGVTLAKICRRLNVPLPGRGYWAKKRAGQPVTIPKLPPLPAAARDSAPSIPPVTPDLPSPEEAASSGAEPPPPAESADEAHLRDLLESLENWRLARDIRAYVSETRALIEEAQLEIKKGGELDRHLEFAVAHAERIDPLGSLRREIEKVAAPSVPPSRPAPPRRSPKK